MIIFFMFEFFRDMDLEEKNILKIFIDYIEKLKRKEIKVFIIEWRQVLINMMYDLLDEKIMVYSKFFVNKFQLCFIFFF